MVDLGVGKNMVRSIRFWAQAAGLIESQKKGSGYSVTDFGRFILGPKGADRFLEDIRTLWLVHWKLCTGQDPLLAWDYLLNRWQDDRVSSSLAVDALAKEVAKVDQRLSPVTIQQHFDTFLHTYIPTRGRKGDVQEDNLDSPLVELELLIRDGEREADASGRKEPVYVFRREEKPDVTPEVFAYCVADFWQGRHPKENTLPFKAVANGHGSPGQIFKIPEQDIRIRLATLEQDSDGAFRFSDTSDLQQIRRAREPNLSELLEAIYMLQTANV